MAVGRSAESWERPDLLLAALERAGLSMTTSGY